MYYKIKYFFLASSRKQRFFPVIKTNASPIPRLLCFPSSIRITNDYQKQEHLSMTSERICL